MGAFYLEINGLDVFVDKFIIEMENIAVLVADNIIDKALLQEIIYSILNEEDYSEALKIKIFNLLSSLEINEEKLGTDFYKNLY